MTTPNLKKSLLYFHVSELRELCEKLLLPSKGKKMNLIERIVHFSKTGEIIIEPKIPSVSKAQKGKDYPLLPQTLMLKGAYKNDLKTRLFFKDLIGDYFHFTAFGIDWLNTRWLEGNPPTYQEFSKMWEAEYARRKKMGSTPKEEWAYINFTQSYISEHPQSTRNEQLKAWEDERQHHIRLAQQELKRQNL